MQECLGVRSACSAGQYRRCNHVWRRKYRYPSLFSANIVTSAFPGHCSAWPGRQHTRQHTLMLKNSAWMRSERVGAAARHLAASSGEGAGRSRNKEPVTDPNASSRTHLVILPLPLSASDSSSPTVTSLQRTKTLFFGNVVGHQTCVCCQTPGRSMGCFAVIHRAKGTQQQHITEQVLGQDSEHPA